MEASLLPSKAIWTLCKQTVVAIVRREEPECAKLRKEFAVPFLNSWVIVLDGKGETLASWIGDAAGGHCNERSVKRFPLGLVRCIRKSLERGESVEELERRWRSRPQNQERFDALARRLEEMQAQGRLEQLCQEAAGNPQLSQQRNDFRIRAFMARSANPLQRRSTRKARTQLVRDGEKLLVELASHPRAAPLVHALFSAGHAHAFDVPGRCARSIARLRKASRQAAEASALEKRIQELEAIREEWIASTKEALQKYAAERSIKEYFAALLGDARAAIKLCSRPGYREDPEYSQWLCDARQKLERDRRRKGKAKLHQGTS